MRADKLIPIFWQPVKTENTAPEVEHVAIGDQVPAERFSDEVFASVFVHLHPDEARFSQNPEMLRDIVLRRPQYPAQFVDVMTATKQSRHYPKP